MFFKGNGDGTFQAPIPLGSITLFRGQVNDFRVVDLNHDSRPDIIATGFGGFSVYLSSGNTVFQAPVNYASGGSNVSSIDVADLDQDGNVDVAIASNGGFTTLRGSSDGTLGAPIYWAVGTLNTQNVRAGDLNGDGKPDVVVGHAVTSPENIFATVLLNRFASFQFSSATYTVGEGAGNAMITVNRAGDTTLSDTVDFATSDDTATSGADYSATIGKLSFSPGQTSKSVSINIVDDTLDEIDETVNLTLSNPNAGTTLVAPSTAVLTILDNDPPPNISINDISKREGKTGTTSFVFDVVLNTASGKMVTVDYATADGSALAGLDYQSTIGTITFLPGQTAKTITVGVNGDSRTKLSL